MSQHHGTETSRIVGRVALAVGVVLLAGIAGLLAGGLVTRLGGETEERPSAPGNKEAPQRAEWQPPKPPLYFYAPLTPGVDMEAIAGEVRMAAGAGVHDYIVRIPLTWSRGAAGADIEPTLYPLDRIEEIDPEAAVLLSVSLNPPESWLAEHSEAAAVRGSEPPKYPSAASATWIEAAKQALGGLLQTLESSPRGARVQGLVLGALENDRWLQSGGYDTSDTNQNGFRDWLRSQYADEAQLRSAWGNEKAGFESAAIPERPDTTDTTRVFFMLPKERARVDFLQYTSDRTADTILEITGYVQQTVQRPLKVYVQYGHQLEHLTNDHGQCGLGLLLEAEIDGFVSPVSYRDRRMGGPGGFMGPVNSAKYHGKQWVILDDTRTGISRDPTTGQIEKVEGLRTDDVMGVVQRNFAGALASGLGTIWADSDGTGALHDTKMWTEFGRMREAYQAVWGHPNSPRPGDFIPYRTRDKRLTLLVVIDEASRFFQRCDAPLNSRVLADVQSAALRAGVPAQFCLLQDVLEGRAAPASIYLFANAFHLPEAERNQLHSVLISQGATALWLYAPGYIAEEASVENVAKTTRLPVKAFDKPEKSGSSYRLGGGQWMRENEAFGESTTWSPLFYIDTEPAKVLATYRESTKPSIALDFFEEGWASVFLAEPAITPNLLREILLIFEQHVHFYREPADQLDTAYFGPGFMAVHASTVDERVLLFDDAYDVRDLIDPEVGWTNKLYLRLSMQLGQTHILELTPSISDALPEDSPAATVEATLPPTSGEPGSSTPAS
jgi:hypothetical protein